MENLFLFLAVAALPFAIVAAGYQLDKRLFLPRRKLYRRKKTTYAKIIAVDFDGTICETAWPGIGPAKRDVINALLARQADGDKVILWTCRAGEQLEEAIAWCANRGLHFDAVNESLPEQIEYFGGDTRKVWAHEYWDDKAVEI